MKYLLDTDISIFLIRNQKNLIVRLSKMSMSDWGISSLTAFEIFKGVKQLRMSVVAEDALKFLSLSTIHNFDFAAAEKAAEVHEQLRLAGKPIGLLDEQIAGQAISLNATLVSNNTKHFSQVPNLKLENWL